MPLVAEPEGAVCGGCGLVRSSLIDEPTERSAGPVRFATFTLENLFARPKVFHLATCRRAHPSLEAFADFNALIEKLIGPIRPPRHVVPS